MYQFAEWLSANPVSIYLAASQWYIPLVQIVHIVSICILFGTSLMVYLRLLGVIKCLGSAQRYFQVYSRWVIGALIALVITGLMLLITEPARQLLALSFWIKLAVIVVTTAIFVSLRNKYTAGESVDVSAGDKSLSGVSVVLWVGVIFLGRFIAYDLQIWGDLSPSAYI